MLNKIPVLDKGHVALMSSSISNEDIKILWTRYTMGFNPQLLQIPTAHLQMKCPLFVQLHLAQFGLSTLSEKRYHKVEAYVPTEAEVAAKDLETSQAIAEDINQTTEALLLNPKSYQYEACDIFISQVISPISVYNTLIVSGSLQQWIHFLQQQNLPSPIEEYRKAIEGLLSAEWSMLEKWIKRDDVKKS